MASYASWADDERSRDPATTRWHFVDLAPGSESYDPSRDCRLVEGQGDCLIAALDREVATVACAGETVERRQRALKFIIHLVGDLSQPVHATGEARGGNDIPLEVAMPGGARPKPAFAANLHEVWDTVLVQKVAWAWGGYVERLEAGLLKGPQIERFTDGGPVDWLMESHAVAADIFASLPANLVLDDAYLAKETPVLDAQLAAGGLRLAKVLNEAFDAKRCPAGP
jgi:hypothetical protein